MTRILVKCWLCQQVLEADPVPFPPNVGHARAPVHAAPGHPGWVCGTSNVESMIIATREISPEEAL
jgi:hypothetical protein